MSSPSDHDPRRWRDLPPSTPGIESEIGVATRAVAQEEGPDELRVAHLRQRALQRAASLGLSGQRFSGAWGSALGWRGSAWVRTAAMVLVSLLLGGVATAVTGRLVERYRLAKARPVAARADANDRSAQPRQRRWRLSVKTPTDLDLSVGPDGAEVAVVDGQARLSGVGISGTVDVQAGRSWREETALPLPPGPPPAGPSAPDLAGSSAPASAPAQSAHPPVAAPSEPEPRARAPRATVAWAEPQRSARPAVTSPLSQEAPATLPPSIVIAAPPPSLVEPPPLTASGPPFPVRLPTPEAATAGGPDERPRPVPPKPPAIGEATLLARALGRLRREHDPLWALADLDEHKRRFPRGELRREAALARAEALLAMDRKADALAVLDAITLGGGLTERPAALARAELRADEGRRGEAIGDFDRVITAGGDDALAERALFGRGLCHLRGGDLGGARADLRAHLERFPSSARRAEVEKLIDRLEN